MNSIKEFVEQKSHPAHGAVEDLKYVFSQCMDNFVELLPFFEDFDCEDPNMCSSILEAKEMLNKINIQLLKLINKCNSGVFEDKCDEFDSSNKMTTDHKIQQPTFTNFPMDTKFTHVCKRCNKQIVIFNEDYDLSVARHLQDLCQEVPVNISFEKAKALQTVPLNKHKENINFNSQTESKLFKCNDGNTQNDTSNCVSYISWGKMCEAEGGSFANILYGEFKCTLCNVIINGPQAVITHVMGKDHQELLRNPTNNRNVISQLWTDILNKVCGSHNHILYIDFKCSLCNIKIKGAPSVLEHLKGKKHQTFLKNCMKVVPVNQNNDFIQQSNSKCSTEKHMNNEKTISYLLEDADLNYMWSHIPAELSYNKKYFHFAKCLKCTLCKCEVPPTVRNVIDHIVGNRHIKSFGNAQENEINVVDSFTELQLVENIMRHLPALLRIVENYFCFINANICCVICDCDVPVHSINCHLDGKNHAKNRVK